MLPQIPYIERSREYTQEFRGYNHNLRIAENEYFDELNLSADNYPLLSTRKPRKKLNSSLDGATVCGAVGRGSDVYFILHKNEEADKEADDETLLYKNDVKTKIELKIALANTAEKRKMLFFGVYLLIFPDCISYNTITNEAEYIYTNVTSEHKDYEIWLQRKVNENYEDIQVTRCEESEAMAAPSKYSEQTLAIVTSNNVLTKIGCLKEITKESEDSNDGTEESTGESEEEKEYKIEEYNSDNFRLKVKIPSDLSRERGITVNFAELTAIPALPITKKFTESSEKLKLEFDENDEKGPYAYLYNVVIPYSYVKIKDGKVSYYDDNLGDNNKELKELKISANIITAYFPMKDYYAARYNFDHIIECQNRLWACFCGKRDDKMINEIYASALGDFNEWLPDSSVEGGAYVASVGTPGAFTGVSVVNQNPVFFKEDCVHKVYVSSVGAHQIVTLTCSGIEEGSSKSVVNVNGYVFYKTRNDIVIFDGTGTSSISSALGDARYKNVIAGASGNKYVLYCQDYNGVAYILSYDTLKGIWHKENTTSGDVVDMIVCDGKLYMIADDIYIHDESSGDEEFPFMLETGEIGLGYPDKKYIARIDLRISLTPGTYMNIFIQYDSEGIWIPAGNFLGTEKTLAPLTLPILPRRCDHFKLKITGNGRFNLYSITKSIEQGE